MVAPFLKTAESVAASAVGSTAVFHRFKISKSRLATDNYAAMSFADRSRTLQNDLILPEGLALEDKSVIVLDDIRVTGLRQAALEHLFATAGVEKTSFYYVLDVPEGKQYPHTEAVINIRSVQSVEDVIDLASHPGFIPNVRLCKFILSQSIEALERFCSSVPKAVADTVLHYIEADNLREVVKEIP